MEKHPVLYSYRRCPYAMRARMAIIYSGLQVEQREILFWDKPEPMLQASPKGTVPVLVLPNGDVIDESRDIMVWALQNSTLENDHAWLFDDEALEGEIFAWIDECDDEFKQHLDHYKYADRFPEHSQQHYRDLGCRFLAKLEQQLNEGVNSTEEHSWFGLVTGRLSLADIAIFPFIRQFANVDKKWFEQAPYPMLQKWLQQNLALPWFTDAMKNRPVWVAGHSPLWVHEPELTTKDQFTAKAIG